jgi:uncharacterized protein (DUF2236 family)
MATYTDSSDAVGYFGPETVTWQLYREPLFILGGVRALILQIAHPAVADGVARFSNFQQDPFGRGYRTFQAMATIYFGDKAQAEATAGRLWRIHTAIKGDIPTPDTGRQAYTANDPELLLWVLATLTDTTLRVYEWLPASGLPTDWRERFYEESKIAAGLLGIPEAVYPANLEAFRAYFDDMLAGDRLGATETCREVAQAIICHPRSPERLARLLAAGWLPGPLCERLGIDAGNNPEVRLKNLLGRVRWWYRLLPRMRFNPAYWQAKGRIAEANGTFGPVLGRWYNWLARFVNIPLGLSA